MDFFINMWDGAKDTSWLEWLAVLSAITYVLLLSYKIIWCWLFAIITSVSYTIICIQANLYLESYLQMFYVIMGIWGWLSWGRGSKERLIRKWKWKWHLINILASGILVVVLGHYFQTYTEQSYPYLDATTTVFSLATTFLVIYRVLSNWVYWIIIDALAMILFFLKGLELTVVLYLLYTLLAIWGYYKWRKEFKSQYE